MMKDTIIAVIKKINAKSALKVADWRLVGTGISRQERYFMRAGTELARSVEELQYSLTVYVDGEAEGKKFRGEATVTIQPSQAEAEMAAKITQAIFAASKSKNPWFDLPGPAEPKVGLPPSGFDRLDDRSRMETARAALYVPETEVAASAKAGADSAAAASPKANAGPRAAPGSAASVPRMNSLELFISRTEEFFLNSKGLAHKTSTWKGYSEFIVETESAQGPVELFDDIEFSDPDPKRLREATGSRLAQVRDRALAVPLPSLGDIPVILSGKEAEQLFGWFFDNSSTGAIFMKTSPFALGMNVQQTEEGGKVQDPIDLWAEPVIAGLVASRPFDPDGFPLERTAVIETGCLKTLVGGIRYADWLGQPRKGVFPLFSVSPGIMGISKMRARPHLEPVMFSDFRLESTTGDFGAEIRLAYWFDGKKRVPVTGGSLSGSVSELRSTMVRSAERAVATRSLCPKALLLRGVSVTSIA